MVTESTHGEPMTTPRRPLTIVMPVLDEAPTIAARLRALADLRARGVEVIVVDGGSHDGTAEEARPHADQVVIAPRGRASQMNAGAAVASGYVLLFLHADTHLPDDADARVAGALDGGHRWGRFDVRIDSRDPTLAMVSFFMNRRSHLSGICTGDQAIFVRRDLFAAAGGFPELPLMEDVAMCDQLRRRGRPARIRTRVITSARRWERHGTWRTIVLMWRFRAEYALGTDPRRLAVRYGYRPRDD